jgi:hypothetical protein
MNLKTPQDIAAEFSRRNVSESQIIDGVRRNALRDTRVNSTQCSHCPRTPLIPIRLRVTNGISIWLCGGCWDRFYAPLRNARLAEGEGTAAEGTVQAGTGR